MVVVARGAARVTAAVEVVVATVVVVRVVATVAVMVVAMVVAAMEAVKEGCRTPRRHSNGHRGASAHPRSCRYGDCCPMQQRAARQDCHDRTPPTSKPACHPDRIP